MICAHFMSLHGFFVLSHERHCKIHNYLREDKSNERVV